MTGFLKTIDHFFSCLGARFWIWTTILAYFITLGFINHYNILGWPNPGVFLGTIDPDVWLRLTKVRELIQDGNLHNHAVIATNAPYGGIETPWTRPLDFILMGLYQFTDADFSIEKRLIIAANWYPLIIGGFIIFFLSKAAETSFKSTMKFSVVVFSIIAYFLISTENSYFRPGNADHHSLQTLLWCIAIWIVLDSPNVIRSIILGLCLGLWAWVSPEALPLIFSIYIIQGVASLMKPSLSCYPMITSIFVTLVSILAVFIEMPPHKIITALYYDTISIVHILFFSFCSVGFIVLNFFISRLENIQKRFIASGLLAAILSIFFLLLFPKFLKGLVADVDPYILTDFLPNIWEATPLLQSGFSISLTTLALPLLALYLCLKFYRKNPILLSMLMVPLGMTLYQLKWYYYLETISIVTIAKLLPPYMYALRKHYKKFYIALHPYVVIVLLVGCITLIKPILPVSKLFTPKEIERCESMGFQLIQSGALVNALGNQPITIETNILGNSGIGFFTPYHYVASFYHREGKGMKIQNALFRAENIERIRPTLKDRNIRALMICPSNDKSWVNSYFANQTPDISWVTINKDIIYPVKHQAKIKPLILMIDHK